MRADLPPAAWVASLAGLPGMGPVRLRAVLERRAPAEAWAAILAGEAPDRTLARLAPVWQSAARRTDVAASWAANEAAGVRVLVRGDPGFPDVLVDDPDPPVVLFQRGSALVALERPRVAIVGTRRCTSAGRAVARQLGRELAEAGVAVVSGLALGIDGAAHAGALEAGGAPPVGVVATGLDVVYPRRHQWLWDDVAAAGLLLGEYPLGTAPERWRFPARNRIIAGLADVVVVVESHRKGGSLHTVEAALERDRPVLAVPGPVRSPASAGTNDLLAAGAAPVRDTADVLVALGLDSDVAARREAAHEKEAEEGDEVLEAVGWEPATLEQVAARLETPLGPIAVHLARLVAAGRLTCQNGWYERVER